MKRQDLYDSDLDAFEAQIKRRSARGAAVKIFVVTIAAVLGVFGIGYLVANATPDPGTAINAVNRAGFTEARVIESGVITFRCSESDSYYYRVAAKNPKGDPTEVTVCCGILKDCTVRY